MPSIVHAAIATGTAPLTALVNTMIAAGVEPNGKEIRACIAAGRQWLWQHRSALPFKVEDPNAQVEGPAVPEGKSDGTN